MLLSRAAILLGERGESEAMLREPRRLAAAIGDRSTEFLCDLHQLAVDFDRRASEAHLRALENLHRNANGPLQRYNVEGLSPSFQGVLDRGVHTAPFYVLIGANMPSILTEVGFISNPEEERWLKSDEYQQKLAESLLEGVRSYLGQLNRTQTTKLGARPGARVAARGRSKR